MGEKSNLEAALEGLEDFEFEDEPETDDVDLDDEVDDNADADADADTGDDTDDAESDADDDDEAEEDDQVTALQTQLAEMRELLNQVISKKPDDKSDDTPAPDLETPAWELEDLVDEDFDVERMDVKDLNALLNKAAETGFKKASKMVYAQILRVMPELIKTNVATQSTVHSEVANFYKTNKDLAGFKNAVKFVAEDLNSRNPGWPIEKLFAETAKETRKRLGLKPVPQKKPKPSNARPKSQKRVETAKPEGVESEIDEMLGALDR